MKPASPFSHFAIVLALFVAFGPSAQAVRHSARAHLPINGTLNPMDMDAKQLRSRLEHVLVGLKGMIHEKNGSLSKAKVAPVLTVFTRELEAVLYTTANSTNETAALSKLRDASAGVQNLMQELSARQEALMADDEAQADNLLLGVLLTKQHKPMEQQLEVLKSKDFAKLPVVKALLAQHNESTPLYLQAAQFLDEHGSKARRADAKSTIEKVAATLQKRVESMEREMKAKDAAHLKKERVFEHHIKSAHSQKERKLMEAMRERERRAFKKFAAVRKQDIASMKAAVEAVKKGDMKALAIARKALMDSLQALKNQNGGFLVLLSLGQETMGGECPYCTAQCISQCREEGKSSLSCLMGECGEGLP